MEVTKYDLLVDALKKESFMGIQDEHPGFINLYEVPGMPKNFTLYATPWYEGDTDLNFMLSDENGEAVESEDEALQPAVFPSEDEATEKHVEAYKKILLERAEKISKIALLIVGNKK